MPLRIPRIQTDLPSDLFLKGSDLDNMVQLATEAADLRSFRSESTIAVARSLVKAACPNYSPSRVNKNDMLCSSGELDGNPIRHECSFCRVGQFSATGFFMGSIVPIEVLIGNQSNDSNVNQIH